MVMFSFCRFNCAMYVKTPEISWHGRDPIYSIDFQVLNGSIQRLATGGADKNVRVCLKIKSNI